MTILLFDLQIASHFSAGRFVVQSPSSTQANISRPAKVHQTRKSRVRILRHVAEPTLSFDSCYIVDVHGF